MVWRLCGGVPAERSHGVRLGVEDSCGSRSAAGACCMGTTSSRREANHRKRDSDERCADQPTGVHASFVPRDIRFHSAGGTGPEVAVSTYGNPQNYKDSSSRLQPDRLWRRVYIFRNGSAVRPTLLRPPILLSMTPDNLALMKRGPLLRRFQPEIANDLQPKPGRSPVLT